MSNKRPSPSVSGSNKVPKFSTKNAFSEKQREKPLNLRWGVDHSLRIMPDDPLEQGIKLHTTHYGSLPISNLKPCPQKWEELGKKFSSGAAWVAVLQMENDNGIKNDTIFMCHYEKKELFETHLPMSFDKEAILFKCQFCIPCFTLFKSRDSFNGHMRTKTHQSKVEDLKIWKTLSNCRICNFKFTPLENEVEHFEKTICGAPFAAMAGVQLENESTRIILYNVMCGMTLLKNRITTVMKEQGVSMLEAFDKEFPIRNRPRKETATQETKQDGIAISDDEEDSDVHDNAAAATGTNVKIFQIHFVLPGEKYTCWKFPENAELEQLYSYINELGYPKDKIIFSTGNTDPPSQIFDHAIGNEFIFNHVKENEIIKINWKI